MLIVVYCLLSCLTWLCSKILLSLYLENSSVWSWKGEVCSSPHREGQRNSATQRPAESQTLYYWVVWTAGREDKGRWKEGTAVEIPVGRDRCVEKAVVCYNCKTCWTWKQREYASFITGTKNFFKCRLFFLSDTICNSYEEWVY